MRNKWTTKLLPDGILLRDERGRPREYLGRIKGRYGYWRRNYRVKIEVEHVK